jgi:CHAT domain-containing protein
VGGLRNGLVMIDSETLETGTISGTTLRPAPFVFLNACEAGTGQKLLGESAGVASAFLKGGAAAVVAPLWKISDRVGRDVATRFYQEVFDGGVQVADFLRKERVSGAEPDSAEATTQLAYVFFGHPRMRLQGPAGGCR